MVKLSGLIVWLIYNIISEIYWVIRKNIFRIVLYVAFMELFAIEREWSLFYMKCYTGWLISNLRFLLYYFGFVDFSSSLVFMVRHTTLEGSLVVLVIVDRRGVIDWWWRSTTSNGYEMRVKRFSSDEFINMYLLNIGSFK